MPSLSSLIVQRQVATIVEVEQAIARQVIHGGDLVTNLLEVAPHCEPALTRVLGETLGMPCMPPGRLPAPANDVLDLLPVETALRSGIFPLRLAGRTLVVVTSELLPATVEHDLAYGLGLDLTFVAAPLIRIREGIAAHYGIPLEPRQLRLVQKLDGAEVARASNRPRVSAWGADLPPSNLRSGVSSPPAASRNPTPVWRHGSTQIPVIEPLLLDEPGEPPPPPEPAAAPPSSESGDRATDPDSVPRSDRETPNLEESEPSPYEARGVALAPPPVDLAPTMAAPSRDAPAPVDPSPRPPGMLDKRALARLLKREIDGTRRSSARTARRKGPLSRGEAERELESAKAPEDVLDTFFAFGSQYFEYSALFVIHGDLAEGRDAWGPGADHLRVLGLGVPLDLPSALASVRKQGRVLLSRFDEDDLDRELRKDLGRARDRPTTVALLPLTVKGRAVAMLYGDDGESDVTLTGLGDLLGFSALASGQLERIAVMKKSKSGRFSGLVAPRSQSVNVSALARALALPGPPGGSSPPGLAGAPLDPSSSPVVVRDVSVPALAPRSDEAPRISPGAASVHPPPVKPDTTKPYDDQVLDSPEPPALGGAPPELEPEPEPEALLPLVQIERPRSSDPFAPTILADAILEGRVPLAGPAASPSEPPSSGDGPETPLHHPFVKPIPRTDEDASSVVAAELEREWDEEVTVRRQRESDRVGTYHLVPRPADARARESAPGSIEELLDRAIMGGLEGEEAMSELLRYSEHSFTKLVELFPGPLTVDRFKARADIPPASECGPILKVLATARRAALPFMTVRSASPDLDQRFWATHLLGELLFPESSNAVLPRLFDEDVSVRRVARRAAQALVSAGPPGEPLKTSLEHTLRGEDEPMHRRLLAIEALAEIRVPAVVPVLVGALRDSSEGIVEAARTALIVVTRQDLGRLPEVWEQWWHLHKDQHRIEWLIQALTHDSPSIRRAAGDELKLVTREYFGYYDDLPPRERERAQDRYLTWWREEGRYKFR